MTAQTAATPTKTKKGAYVVFKLIDFPDPQDGAVMRAWMAIGGPVEAANSDAAIRARADVDKGGDYMAIPARSYKRVTVTAQTVTTLKLEEAK